MTKRGFPGYHMPVSAVSGSWAYCVIGAQGYLGGARKFSSLCNFCLIPDSLGIKAFLKFDEAEVIRNCLKGDSKAQELLYTQFAGRMTGLVYRYAGNGDDAQDILQEGFLKVFRYLNTYKATGSLEGWIRRIMVNMAIDHCKKNTRYAYETNLENDIELSDAEYDMLYKVEQDHLMCLINALPEGFRLIFNMYAIEGFSHKEIAVQLNISENTVRTQYIRAKKRLLDGILVTSNIQKTP